MSEKVLMKGNEALAESAIRAGCRCFFGYPITPQTEVAAYMSKRMPQVGGTYLQAESEVSAINMIYGAVASGARAMTSTSSPGVSLMAEGISYLAGSDLPAVIVNIVRGGPGLGGIQPAQSDYNQTVRGLAHGDFHVIALAPSGIQEMCDFIAKAFDLADKYRVPAMILGDGMLGQMMEPVALPEPKESTSIDKPWATCGTGMKRQHNIINSLYIEPDVLEKLVMDRYERYKVIEKNETLCENYMTDDADIVIVAYGACSRISRNAVRAARAEGIKVGMFRPITLWPFPSNELYALTDSAKAFLSVELSMGQMIDDVNLATKFRRPVYLANHTGGVVITPDEILAKLREIKKEVLA